MENVNVHFLIHLVILCCILIPNGNCLARKGRQTGNALFVFGDSLFDPGNNNYINTTTQFQANFYPYGESYFENPTGRFSDGRLIPDFIAEFAKLPEIPAYLEPGNQEFVYGANFASAGAGTLVETNAGFVVDLLTQLQQFNDVEKQLKQKLGDSEAKQVLSNAVYLFNCGINDYNFTRSSTTTGFIRRHVGMVMGNLTLVIKGIYDKGGKKFGILSLPSLACWPNTREIEPNHGCKDERNAIVNMHNRALSANLYKLEKQLKGFMYSTLDLYTTFTERIDNPTKYGFKYGDRACCGSGPYGGSFTCGGTRGSRDYKLCDNSSEYFFFDSYHPNEVAHKQLAELFWRGKAKLSGRHSLKSLFDLSE